MLLPKQVGLEDAIKKVEGDWLWFGVASGSTSLAFASYVALFRGVVGEHVKLPGARATRSPWPGWRRRGCSPPGGAGGIVLSYWALRKAGMPRRQSAARMVAFLVLLYAFYMLAVVDRRGPVTDRRLRRAEPGRDHDRARRDRRRLIVVFLLIALVPTDLERRMRSRSRDRLVRRTALRLATVPVDRRGRRGLPSTSSAIPPRRAGGRGAIGFWAANIGILWASFQAFEVQVPLGVIVQGFFVGMAANLVPFAPAGSAPSTPG